MDLSYHCEEDITPLSLFLLLRLNGYIWTLLREMGFLPLSPSPYTTLCHHNRATRTCSFLSLSISCDRGRKEGDMCAIEFQFKSQQNIWTEGGIRPPSLSHLEAISSVRRGPNQGVAKSLEKCREIKKPFILIRIMF